LSAISSRPVSMLPSLSGSQSWPRALPISTGDELRTQTVNDGEEAQAPAMLVTFVA
jgi:hypothetical protein